MGEADGGLLAHVRVGGPLSVPLPETSIHGL